VRTTDRRFVKTEAVIIKAMVKLLNASDIQKISVLDLCETADINKSTLYLHYRSLDQVVSTIEDEVVSDINSIIYSLNAERLNEDFVDAMLVYIKKHQKRVIAAIRGGRTRFNEKFVKALLPYMAVGADPTSRKKISIDDIERQSRLTQLLYVISIYSLNLTKIKESEIKPILMSMINVD